MLELRSQNQQTRPGTPVNIVGQRRACETTLVRDPTFSHSTCWLSRCLGVRRARRGQDGEVVERLVWTLSAGANDRTFGDVVGSPTSVATS